MTLDHGPIAPAPSEARRGPGWLPILSGAALALGASELALEIGLAHASGLRPVHLRLVALVGGALLGRTRWAWLLWLVLLVTSGTFLLIAFTPLVDGPVLRLVRADAEGAPVDAVVVYSGVMTDAGDIGDIALTRLVSALDDVQRLRVPHLVVSEQSRPVRGRVVRTGADQRRVASLLGAGTEVHVVGPVYTTHDESVAFAAFARSRGWTRVRAVTSPLHARRACATLEATGLSVTCAPATSRNAAISRPTTSGARLDLWRDAVHEFVGLAVYRLRGWI